MKKWHFAIIFLSLLVFTSCSPTREDFSTPTPMPTLELPTPTPTATEAPQYEPGTVVLDPEYSFDGQIEIIEENQGAFYDNFLDSLIRINRDYFKALKTSQGVEVTDVASLRIYLEENDWIVPAGLHIPIMSAKGGSLAVELSQPCTTKMSLKNLGISFVSFSELDNSATIGYMNGNNLFTPYRGASLGYSLGLGYLVREKEGISAISIIVVQKKDTNGVGFPGDGNTLSSTNMVTLDIYVRYILYVMRTMQVDPQSELEKQMANLHNPGYDYFVTDINTSSGVGMVSDTASLFSSFKQQIPPDAAPEIIRLK